MQKHLVHKSSDKMKTYHEDYRSFNENGNPRPRSEAFSSSEANLNLDNNTADHRALRT